MTIQNFVNSTQPVQTPHSKDDSRALFSLNDLLQDSIGLQMPGLGGAGDPATFADCLHFSATAALGD